MRSLDCVFLRAEAHFFVILKQMLAWFIPKLISPLNPTDPSVDICSKHPRQLSILDQQLVIKLTWVCCFRLFARNLASHGLSVEYRRSKVDQISVIASSLTQPFIKLVLGKFRSELVKSFCRMSIYLCTYKNIQ